MRVRLMTLSLAAAGLLVASSIFDPADARRGGGGGHGGGGAHARAGGGGHSIGMRSMGPRSTGPRSMGIRSGSGPRVYSGGHALRGHAYRSRGGHRHAHRHHRHHRHRFVGVPLGLYAGYGYYGSYYGDGCEWLRQQALYSGSIYWWDRYNACVSGYDY